MSGDRNHIHTLDAMKPVMIESAEIWRIFGPLPNFGQFMLYHFGRGFRAA